METNNSCNIDVNNSRGITFEDNNTYTRRHWYQKGYADAIKDVDELIRNQQTPWGTYEEMLNDIEKLTGMNNEN